MAGRQVLLAVLGTKQQTTTSAWDSKEWVCIDQEPVWGTAIKHEGMSKILDICFSKDKNNISPSGSDRLCRRTLLDQFSPKADPAEIRLMTDNYIIGGEGYYMPRESFLYLRKCERMIEKITTPHTHQPIGPHYNSHQRSAFALVPSTHKLAQPKF